MAAGLATGLTGCATIINGKNETISVTTTPPGAEVHIKSADGSFSTTAISPATIVVPRGSGYFHGNDYIVNVAKDGYAAQTDQFTHHVSGWYAGGNLLFGGLIGYLFVDPATGSMWKLDKESVNFQLQPSNGVAVTPLARPASAGTTAPATVPVAAVPAAPAAIAAAPSQAGVAVAAAPAPAPTQIVMDTSKLKLGTWSYEVHEMAKKAGCTGDGAWLVTDPSPVQEAYREACSTGGYFTAVCDSVHCERQ